MTQVYTLLACNVPHLVKVSLNELPNDMLSCLFSFILNLLLQADMSSAY